MRSNLFGTFRRIPRARYIPAPLLGMILLLLAGSGVGEAQETGRIVGRVISTQTGEGLASVRVSVVGAAAATFTDASGRYSLSNVPAGIQSLSARAAGYASKTVTDVEVAASSSTSLDISLAPEAVALEGLTVTAERERGSTSALLSERQRAAVVVDAIGSEQIGRTPDSDAAEVMQRVPGVSVVDGQFVYVRGLGERYGATTLNGAPLPSPLPDTKAVPLDVIPANLLESIVLAKTYSPDQPGDYAGGLVQIQTRKVPTSRTLRLSTSLGYNTAVSFQPSFTNGDGLGFFGFGDGVSRLPDGLLSGEDVSMPTDSEVRRDYAQALTRGFGLVEEDAPLNRSYGIAYGDEWFLGGKPVGIVGSLSTSNSYGAPEENAERTFGIGDGAPQQDVAYDINAGEQESSLGALLGVSFEVAPAQRLTATGTYTRLVEDQTRVFAGPYENVAPFVRSFQSRYVANSIANLQLEGEHLIQPLGGLSARWRASYGRADHDEPGTRTAAYGGASEDAPLFFVTNSSSGLIFAQDLQEDLASAALDLKLPFTFRSLPAFLSFGGGADFRDRAVSTRRILLDPVGNVPGDTALLLPGELFVPERIGTELGQFDVRDRTLPEDNYDADQTVLAGYAMIDVEVLPKLRAVGGARVEVAEQNVEVRGSVPVGAAGLDNTDILPALNLTYALNPSVNFRAAVSRTVARPEFRERAPFLYADYFGGTPTRGNPFVQRSSILNYDLRAEWFAPNGTLLSVSGFAKRFDDPIEPVFFYAGTNRAVTYANSESALLYGAEFEVRTDLGFAGSALENLTVNANLTLVESEVEGDSVATYDPADRDEPFFLPVNREGDRALYNQSPYVVNLGFSYFQPNTGTTATVLFNRFGRRLDARGLNDIPDIYEEARGQLDLTVEQPLGRGLAMKVAAERLLGGDVEFTQTFPNGDVVSTREYTLGRTYSVSLSWEPWQER